MAMTLGCERCGTQVLMGEAYQVREARWCRPCTRAALAESGGTLTAEDVHPLQDTSRCERCGVLDASDLQEKDGRRICGACRAERVGLRFPRWVKLASLGVLVLTGGSFVHSWRFIRGFFLYKQAGRALSANDEPRAARLMAQAAARVPEDPGFQGLAHLYAGFDALKQERYREAVKAFRSATEALGEESDAPKYLLHAQGALAFEEKRYADFLEAMESLRKRTGDTYDALARVASATACRFAETGDAAFKRKALDLLAQAQKTADFDAKDFTAFEQRMAYRLTTRDIIDQATFEARFPKGWTKPVAQGGE